MRIAILGGGNMGTTYARAFVRSNILKKEDLLIIEKHIEKREELNKEQLCTLSASIPENLSSYNIIILAVKPQDFKVLASELKAHINSNHIVISIMAGININTIEQSLDHKNVVRAMPNTPAQLGFGITAFTVNKSTNMELVSVADTLFETTGKAVFMKDEELLDAVTALSGSGPAYFYYFVKHMIEAGKEMGMEDHIAAMLVKQTMLGAFQIMNNSSNSLDQMIQAVASKGGTTEAALKYFEQHTMGATIKSAIKAAEKRAKELSQGG